MEQIRWDTRDQLPAIMRQLILAQIVRSACACAAAEKSYAIVQYNTTYTTSRGGWAAVWLPKLLLTPSSRFFPTSTKQELQTRLIFGKKCSMRGGGRPNPHHSSLSTPGFYVQVSNGISDLLGSLYEVILCHKGLGSGGFEAYSYIFVLGSL